MGSSMADYDTSYRTPRRRPGMDPNTRRLAIIAGGIGASLVVLVGTWSLTGGRSGGVPVVEANSRPLRERPSIVRQGPEIEGPAAPGQQALAPTTEDPDPEALKAQAVAAAAAAAAATAAARVPAAQSGATAAREPAPAAAPPTQPVALTSPVASAPAARHAPAVAARTPAPAAAQSPASSAHTAATGRTQVQLAALRSEQAALAEWNRLAKKMPDVLGGRRPAIVKYERGSKTFWRLRTGGFADTSQASSFCARVKAKGASCAVASF